MSELPVGWAEARLSDVTELKYGKSLPAKARAGGPVQVYGSNGQVGNHAEAVTMGPTIVVGRKGSIGEIHFSDAPCFPIDTTYFIDEFHGMPPRFLELLLKSLKLTERNRASAIPGLNRDDAYSSVLALPPLDEQGRIVAKLDSLRARSSRALHELDRIPKLIERYKQAILAKAFSGELTEDWRNIHDLPEWNIQQVAELGDVKGGKRLPSGHDYVPGPTQHPYIRVTDFRNGTVAQEGLKYISADTHALISRYTINSCDVYISIAGSIGFVGTIPTHISGANLTENAAKICNLRNIETQYLSWFLRSKAAQQKIAELTVATGQPKLALFRIETIEVPVPHKDEQAMIVRLIDHAFTWLDKIATEHARAEHLLPKLDQAILAKAFRGELVPQDPNDEPASVLLERIKAERADGTQPARRRGRA